MSPEEIASVIGRIYEAAYDPEAWPIAISAMLGLFDGSRACLGRVGPNPTANDVTAANEDTAFRARFLEEHVGQPNVFLDAVFKAPPGLVYNDHALVGADRLRRSRFWNDWMKPQDMYGGLGSKLLVSGRSFWFFDVQRGRKQAAFGNSDAEILQMFIPHLARAVELSSKFQSMQVWESAFEGLPFGVMLVDCQMQIIRSNAVAEELLLRPGGALRRKSGRLFVADAEAELRTLMEQACSVRQDVIPGTGGDLLIWAKHPGRSGDIAISVGPVADTHSGVRPFVQGRAAVYVREIVLDLPQGFQDYIRALFDLSPREAGLAASLASGRTLQETAQDMHVAYSTMRTHLERVFQKTGTRQQSQLVALLKSVQPVRR